MKPHRHRGVRWLQRLLAAAILLLPIWAAPVRTAPVELHAGAWVLAILSAGLYFLSAQATMRDRQRRLWLECIGTVLGVGLTVLALWDSVRNVGPEGKLVGLYFVLAVALAFVFTHRRADGGVN